MSASAASRFAVALHRRTHMVTSALAYAVLEWILIALLLIDGLLAYAIARFADHFGLRPPCLLCSRVDRLFQEGEDGHEAGGARWLRGVLCGAHAAEISGIGYCLRHRRLADAADMCEGCLSSWKKEGTNDAGEKGAVSCSCCQAVVEISSRELEDTREDPVNEKTAEEEEGQGYVLLDQEEDEDEEDEQKEVEQQEQQKEVEQQEQQKEVEQQEQQEEEGQEHERKKVAAVDDETLEFMAQGEEINTEDDRLVPVVALDEMTIADDSGWHRNAGEEDGDTNRIDNELDSDDLDIGVVWENMMQAYSVAAMIENSSIVPIPCAETVVSSSDPDENPIPQVQDDEVVLEDTVEIGDPRAEREDIIVPQVAEAVPEDGNRSDVEINCDNEAKEDRAPNTLAHIFATPNSDRKFLLERKRSLSLSIDGSVSSEIECGAEPSTIEQLKTTLQAERKALGAMYAELEEERSAAAVATNQTMAMINRLQEEKAAMQMEALQYQRMMEEQSEYDQEALQLLAELVTRREREKQELERELELCRHKVLRYEDEERGRTASFGKDGNGSSVSSSGDDTGEHSDEYCELGESPDDGGDLRSLSDAALSPRKDQENTGHLVALDDSLTYFEMERLSILEELKTLEERLFTLEVDDDMNDASHSSDDHELSADGARSPANGLTTGEKPKPEGRNPISRGKSLLPLFDAVGDENRDRKSCALTVDDTEADDPTRPVAVFAKEQERLAIIEEVDHVYERLQALEADKEFLRHCIKSLKKGDKGMHLLQEILQHLRELRNVELHVKNGASDALAANSA